MYKTFDSAAEGLWCLALGQMTSLLYLFDWNLIGNCTAFCGNTGLMLYGLYVATKDHPGYMTALKLKAAGTIALGMNQIVFLLSGCVTMYATANSFAEFFTSYTSMLIFHLAGMLAARVLDLLALRCALLSTAELLNEVGCDRSINWGKALWRTGLAVVATKILVVVLSVVGWFGAGILGRAVDVAGGGLTIANIIFFIQAQRLL